MAEFGFVDSINKILPGPRTCRWRLTVLLKRQTDSDLFLSLCVICSVVLKSKQDAHSVDGRSVQAAISSVWLSPPSFFPFTEILNAIKLVCLFCCVRDTVCLRPSCLGLIEMYRMTQVLSHKAPICATHSDGDPTLGFAETHIKMMCVTFISHHPER